MKIGSTTIVTPTEDPLSYPLNWRELAATAVVSQGKGRHPQCVADDPYISEWITFLKKPSGRKRAACARARAWHEQDNISATLSAYLLTELSYSEIGDRLGALSDDIQLFERIFFAIRDEKGDLPPPAALHVRIHPPAGEIDALDFTNVLQVAAVTGGISLLNKVLGLDPPSNPGEMLAWLTDCELTRRILQSGKLSTGDLARLQNAQTARKKVEVEDRQAEAVGDGHENVLKILQMFKPHLVTASKTDDEKKRIEDALQSKFAAAEQNGETGVKNTNDHAGEARLSEITDSFREKAQQHASG